MKKNYSSKIINNLFNKNTHCIMENNMNNNRNGQNNAVRNENKKGLFTTKNLLIVAGAAAAIFGGIKLYKGYKAKKAAKQQAAPADAE